METRIFISHRSTDKDIAEMLRIFFIEVGIPNECVFCSSLPGNDIRENIPREVKDNLKTSVVNIAILSQDYYKSAYCLNEAGIIWFQETDCILIALPEITPANMIGFLSNDNKLRRLNNPDDISSIYDIVRQAVNVAQVQASVITTAVNHLVEKYTSFLQSRITETESAQGDCSSLLKCISTDDERVVLYYFLSKQTRCASENEVEQWLIENEIHGISTANAFDLFSASKYGGYEEQKFFFEIEFFRKLAALDDTHKATLLAAVNKHISLSSERVLNYYMSESIEEIDLLFIAYIIDENVSSFGFRWMADYQINSIKRWEDKMRIGGDLSSNYERCLSKIIYNKLVYESSWTSYGNPREYTLYKSVKDLLFNDSEGIRQSIDKTVCKFELPF